MLRAFLLLSLMAFSACAENNPLRESTSPALIGNLMPAFYNGYLYSCQPRHILTLFAPDGNITLTLPMQGRGGGPASVHSVAIDSDGTLAMSWTDDSFASGIDFRDSLGNLLRSIDTGRYVPSHLSFGKDHSLWAFGWQRDATMRSADKRGYSTVRRYSMPDVKQTGAYLPRSLFPSGLEPGDDHWQERGITVTDDRIGIDAISGTDSNQREWVELDLDGNLIGRWRLERYDQFPGVVLTDDNNAYVHRYNERTKILHLLRLNREESIWEQVPAGPAGALYGADGNQLIFADWSDGVMHMKWYPQP